MNPLNLLEGLSDRALKAIQLPTRRPNCTATTTWGPSTSYSG